MKADKRQAKLDALVEKYMKSGKYSLAEATEMAEWDLDTDDMSMGEISAELTPEEKAARKAATKVSRGPAAPGEKKARKPRKEDPVKRQLMALVAQALTDAGYTGVDISNPEKIVDFVFDGAEYSFSLTKHRPKKED